jgi:hypothetical protein
VKHDLTKDNEIEFADDPVFIDNLKGDFMDACEIG